MDKHVVAKDVALYGLHERLPAALQSFEQVRAAEAHKPLAGAGQILKVLALFRGWRRLRCRGDIVGHAIAGKPQVVDEVYNVLREKPSVLVGRVAIPDGELHRPWFSDGKVRLSPIGKRQVMAIPGRIECGVVGANEAASAAHEIQPHQITPVVRMRAVVER
jgi:hypothetical protein